MNEAFLQKAKSANPWLDFLASLRLTVALLVLSMLLVLLGTLEQVHWGVWHIQKEYFSSWFCLYPLDRTAGFHMPLPGGFLLGALLIVNLFCAHARHVKLSVRHFGNTIIHAGLILLLAGGFITALYQEESAMVIPEGESRNYSEAFRSYELFIIEKTMFESDKVTAIPDELLVPKSKHALGEKPFSVEVLSFVPNSILRAQSQLPDGQVITTTSGIGSAKTKLAYKALPESFDDNEANSPTGLVRLVDNAGQEISTWVVNPGLTEAFPAQHFTYQGKNYEIGLRRTRTYYPFAVLLEKFTHEKYPGTNTPKRFASDVSIRQGKESFNFNISMNNPLRHQGYTFFQSSFGNTKEGRDLTVLQVVRNPGAWIPYVSVLVMSLGLLWHFGVGLFNFLLSRKRQVATVTALLLLGHLSTQAAETSWSSQELANIPVQSGGRLVPIETLASGSLLQMRSRREIRLTDLEKIAFGVKPSQWTKEQREAIAKELPTIDQKLQEALEKRPVRLEGNALKAVDWLIEVAFRPVVARHLPTFRIEHPVVLKMVGRDAEKTLYASWDDILKNSAKVSEAAEKARKRAQADRDAEDRALIQLETAARQYATLSMTFVPGDLPAEIAPQREYEAWLSSIRRAIEEMNANRLQGGEGKAFNPELQNTVRSFVERYQEFAREGTIGIIPPKEGSTEEHWDNLGTALLSVIQDRSAHRAGLAPDGILSRYASFCVAWREGDDDTCTTQVRAISASLQGPWSKTIKAEADFSRLQPFYWLLIAYAVTVLLVLGAWLLDSEKLRVWAYRLLILCFILHTISLLYRMMLHGRPPVTNLYSSGIFIAWGAVGLGLILEAFWKNGIASMATGVCGFGSLIIAHNLGLSGEDNLESVRAVLDSNFWLATHVTVVTSGYAATFVAGMLAATHLILRVLKPNYAWGESVTRACYGVLAFATIASFIGTMLGGIWADQSWGRFWGWDPKENGAILIVLWCAVCLHARWGGLVRREGLMQMLVFGNIVTSWSWFGTNLLGVGLHSYGFTESGFYWLTAFWISQISIIALGWLPARTAPTPQVA